MEFIFPSFDISLFPEEGSDQNKKMSISDDPLLLELFRNIFERHSLFDVDNLCRCHFRRRDEEKPIKNENDKKKESQGKEKDSTSVERPHCFVSCFG
jgi:hypothetical protein